MLALSEHERALGLQLPDRVAPRVAGLVAQWQASTDRAALCQMVARALDFFRNEPFVYTLTPGTLQGDPVEQFLFETRRGFCEHYAGSFALLMRVAGIPARVVIGYQGAASAILMPTTGSCVSPTPRLDRGMDPGAWLVARRPTAAVAPDRIEAADRYGGSEPVTASCSATVTRVRLRWQNAVAGRRGRPGLASLGGRFQRRTTDQPAAMARPGPAAWIRSGDCTAGSVAHWLSPSCTCWPGCRETAQR